MSEKNSLNKPFSNTELSSFCGQMALILKSGISSVEGLELMLEDTANAEEKVILQTLLDEMAEHGSLSQALSSTELFPPYLTQMVQIGEETGTLDEVMHSLESHYEREADIARSIKNAVTYPIMMVGMMVLVILILLIKVMPIFQQVFLQLGTEMTGISRVLMNMGTAISRYSIFFVALLLLVVVLGFYMSGTSSGKKLATQLASHIPAIRKIQEEIAACRFASGMALTLRSGFDQEHSMELVSELITDPHFQNKIEQCKEQIASGEDFAPSLFRAGIFTGMYARMASIGSKTGSMDQVMAQIAELYQEEIDTRMNHFLSILEPTLVIALSLIVGIILLSVMLPLMGIMSGI